MEYVWKVKSPNLDDNLNPLGLVVGNVNNGSNNGHHDNQHPTPSGQQRQEPGGMEPGQFDGNVYTIDRVNENHNDLVVICTVYNAMGQGTSETRIKITGR